jgi:hypothetical protein
MVKAISIVDKLQRQDAIDAFKKEILDDYDARSTTPKRSRQDHDDGQRHP